MGGAVRREGCGCSSAEYLPVDAQLWPDPDSLKARLRGAYGDDGDPAKLFSSHIPWFLSTTRIPYKQPSDH